MSNVLTALFQGKTLCLEKLVFVPFTIGTYSYTNIRYKDKMNILGCLFKRFMIHNSQLS